MNNNQKYVYNNLDYKYTFRNDDYECFRKILFICI